MNPSTFLHPNDPNHESPEACECGLCPECEQHDRDYAAWCESGAFHKELNMAITPKTVGQHLQSLHDDDASAVAESLRGEFQDVFDMKLETPCGNDCMCAIDKTRAFVCMLDDAGITDAESRWELWFKAGEAVKVLARG